MASGSRGKKVGVFLKNLPHKLRCDRCEINVVCPKVIKEYKSIEEQVGAKITPGTSLPKLRPLVMTLNPPRCL